ncbi:MAG TPA: hypothetical protein VGV18_02285 [Verrucomicrobiae bacterium]|nr:hypothetical protein [Verrucomicrobiae bacterium]
MRFVANFAWELSPPTVMSLTHRHADPGTRTYGYDRFADKTALFPFVSFFSPS